jgi:hypothetical protein
MPASEEKGCECESAPFLFSKETIESFTDAERHGEYTLERIRQLRPELIGEVIRLRGQFVGQLRIARILGVHHRTVAAIDRAYPERIEQEKQRRAAKLRSVADKLVELVDDNPESIPPNVRCLAASQLIDKAELLARAPTQRIELGPPVDIHAMFNELIDQGNKAVAQAKADGRELTAVEKARMDALLDALELGVTGQVPKLIDIAPVNRTGNASETGFDGEKNFLKSDVNESPCP